MTTAQKIQLRLSEVRSRMAEISILEGSSYTDEIRNEQGTLLAEFRDLESRHTAAIVSEGAEQATAAGQFGNGDGEPAEVRALLDRVHLVDYLAPAAGGLGLAGAPWELAAALKVPAVGPGGGVAVPWRMLLGQEMRTQRPDGTEHRAFTTTGAYDGGTMQRPILQRLFGPGVLDALGVRMDSVPGGHERVAG